MSELTDFLLARYAEDEAGVGADEDFGFDRPHWSGCNYFAPEHMGGGECDCNYPARVLADVEARRQIVRRVVEIDAEYDRAEKGDGMVGAWAVEESVGLDIAVRALALPYADHPDYREEWAL